MGLAVPLRVLVAASHGDDLDWDAYFRIEIAIGLSSGSWNGSRDHENGEVVEKEGSGWVLKSVAPGDVACF